MWHRSLRYAREITNRLNATHCGANFCIGNDIHFGGSGRPINRWRTFGRLGRTVRPGPKARVRARRVASTPSRAEERALINLAVSRPNSTARGSTLSLRPHEIFILSCETLVARRVNRAEQSTRALSFLNGAPPTSVPTILHDYHSYTSGAKDSPW